MNIETMKEFVDLVRFANFSDAARHLNMSQSTLSKHIISLEKSLKCQLVERDSRNFGLTPQGQTFYETSIAVLDAYTRGINLINSKQRIPTVTVGGITSSYPVSRLLSQVKTLSTQMLDINVIDGLKLPLDVALLEGRIDICFGPFPEAFVAVASNFEFIPISKDRIIALVSSNSELWERDSLSIRDLVDQVLIRVSDGFTAEPGWGILEELCQSEGFIPRSRMLFSKTDPLTLAENEVFLLPECESGSTISQYGSDKVKAIPITDSNAVLMTYLVALKETRSAGANRFIHHAHEAIQEHSNS